MRAIMLGIWLGLGGAAMAQPCVPSLGSMTDDYGLDAPAEHTAIFEELGPGAPARLFLSGGFSVAGGQAAAGLARWDGETLTAVQDAPPGVKGAMRVFDDGSGPAVYIAGAPGVIHRYFGLGGWDQIAAPQFAGLEGTPESFAAFDPDGEGAGGGPRPLGLFALVHYAGLAGEANAVLWRYDAEGWARLSGAVPRGKIIAYDADGHGPGLWRLYHYFNVERQFPGHFTGYVRRLAEDHWELIGYTSNSFGPAVRDATVFYPAENELPVLVVGGFFERFYDAGGVSQAIRGCAVWDDTQWRRGPLVGPWFARVDAIESYYLPGRRTLVFGATFPQLMSEASWSRNAPPAPVAPLSTARPFYGQGPTLLRSFDPDAAGTQLPQMVTAGASGLANGQPVRNFAVWAPPPSASGWKGVEPAPLGPVHALQIFDDGSGRSLFVGGRFWSVGDMPVGNIARWDGERWHAVGAGLALGEEPTARSAVTVLAVHDDGAGLALYAGITYKKQDGGFAGRLAVWRDGLWTVLAGSDTPDTPLLSLPITELVSHDADGAGPQPASLYALGIFGSAGETRVARWTGSNWHVQPIWAQTFLSLKSLREGSGHALYVTGWKLEAQGLLPTPVMKLAGTWSGMPFHPDMLVTDIGLENSTGEYRLVIARSAAGGAMLSRRDAPGVWTDLGGLAMLNPEAPVRHVQAPDGPSVFAGSYLYDGSSVLQYGTYQIGEITPAFDDGNGAAVFVAGETALGQSVGRIGRVTLCPPPPLMAGCYANCDGSEAAPVLNAADLTCFLQRFAAGDAWANCDGSRSEPVLNTADFTCFLRRFAMGCP